MCKSFSSGSVGPDVVVHGIKTDERIARDMATGAVVSSLYPLPERIRSLEFETKTLGAVLDIMHCDDESFLLGAVAIFCNMHLWVDGKVPEPTSTDVRALLPVDWFIFIGDPKATNMPLRSRIEMAVRYLRLVLEHNKSSEDFRQTGRLLEIRMSTMSV